MKLTKFVLLVLLMTGSLQFMDMETVKDTIKHPLVLGGLGYLYYNAGKKEQENKLQDLQLQDQISLNNLIGNQSKNIEWQNKILNKVDTLEVELNELGAHFTSHVHVLRGVIESYANNDIPMAKRVSAVDALQSQIDRIYGVVKKNTVDEGESDADRQLKAGKSGVILGKKKDFAKKGDLSVRR